MSEPKDVEKTLSTQMHLSPGAPRRKAKSGCRCLFWTAVLLGTLIGGWLLYLVLHFVFLVLSGVIGMSRFPHRALYQNASLAEVPPNIVVRPLIDEHQTFDIAVSVWVRAPKAEEQEHKRINAKEGHSRQEQVDEERGKRALQLPKENSTMWIPGSAEDPQYEDDNPFEIPMFSDVVFRGLHISDKNILRSINFRFPTARFHDVNLTSYDLRGSFVLIPTSPSLLDSLKNYSSWIPDSVPMVPRRAWPFPLGSPYKGEQTLADHALESFGISVPLIEFHEIKSRCPNSTAAEGDSKASGTVEFTSTVQGDDNEEEEEEVEQKKAGTEKKKKIPIHKVHPHVVARTQLRILDETRLFNRKAYNKAHKQLKANACGQGTKDVKPNWRLCNRNYPSNGHWETRLQLEMAVQEDVFEDRVQTAWAYAPYLTPLKHAAGPRDLIPVPVNRENCSTTDNGTMDVSPVANSTDQEFMDITWHISFSGRSPGKHAFGNMLTSWSPTVKHESELKEAMNHNAAELINGLGGHKFYEDAHPRRRLLFSTLQAVAIFAVTILDIHYWYTRRSTVSISIMGTALIALSNLLTELLDTVAAVQDGEIILGGWIITVSMLMTFICLVVPSPFVMIKAIARVEFGWWKGTKWIPVVWRAPASHRERASQRLDARTSWRTVLVFFLSLVAIYHFVSPHDYLIIPSLVPEPSPQDSSDNKLLQLKSIAIAPLEFTGAVLQLLLNHRSRAFAGTYKTTLFLLITVSTVSFGWYMPAIIGRYDVRHGLSLHGAVQYALLLASGWQALTLPSVPQAGGDEDEE